jgi:hypothetical protein
MTLLIPKMSLLVYKFNVKNLCKRIILLDAMEQNGTYANIKLEYLADYLHLPRRYER